MLLASGCESSFIVKFQVFTLNGSERVCDRFCFQLQALAGSALLKLHAFIITSCFDRLIRQNIWPNRNSCVAMKYGSPQIKDFIDNRPKFYLFPAMFMFCKVNILLFSGLLYMISGSVTHCDGIRWVGNFNKTPILVQLS